jgi:hypothetical protein
MTGSTLQERIEKKNSREDLFNPRCRGEPEKIHWFFPINGPTDDLPGKHDEPAGRNRYNSIN